MALAMGLAIVISVIVYLLLVVALRVITKEELELVPKGEKIAKLLRIK
jgi:stage V sporulation protein B